MLSVIIITKNEEGSIGRCLESVAWADEIIVVDSGSTDATLEICREFTDRIVITDDWPGFGPQKNRALAKATGDWVLSLDADEQVTPELRADIEQVMHAAGNGDDAYRMPRRSNFCGRYMQHAGWWPDYVLRLFRRGTAEFSDDLVHERLVTKSRVRTLNHPLMHDGIQDIADALQKMDRYSSDGAVMQFDRGKRGGMTKAVSRGLWAFLRTFVFRGGFLAGRHGFILSVANAEGTYYRYLKMQEMAEKAA